MKKFLLLSICFLISFNTIAQTKIEAKELTKKELRALKKQKAFEKQKVRYEKRGLNAWGINENALNVVMAIREHLGSARIDTQRGLVIIRQSESLTNSQAYTLWIIDGQQYSFPPSSMALQNIREVTIFESLAETNKWGQQGRAGVIQIKTINSLN
jgi:hypothetical protein